MISISKNLIRNARAHSADNEEDGAEEQSDVLRMLGSSPPEGGGGADADGGVEAAGGDDGDDASSAHAGSEARQAQAQTPQHPARARVAAGAGATGSPGAFAKVPVAPRKSAGAAGASGLSRGLERSGPRHGAFEQVGAPGGPSVQLDVFVPGEPVLRLKIQGAADVEDVIDLVIKRSKAGLLPDSDAYELRMLDDDEGTPDLDMPPLDRTRSIHDFGVDAVALCERPGYEGGGGGGGLGASSSTSSMLRNRTRSSRGVSLDLNVSMRGKVASGVFFIKVRLADHQAYTFRVREDQKLEELLPMVSKKRAGEAVTAELYKFVYVGRSGDADDETPLGMDTAVGDLESEEVCLVRRDAAAMLRSIPEALAGAEAPEEHKFTFTQETAAEYERFSVIKTNQRGRRQERVMAIDGELIHNIDPAARNVVRAHRRVADVRSIARLPDNPRAFRIEYRENDDVREYEAETRLECARIVAKVEYLMRYHRR